MIRQIDLDEIFDIEERLSELVVAKHPEIARRWDTANFKRNYNTAAECALMEADIAGIMSRLHRCETPSQNWLNTLHLDASDVRRYAIFPSMYADLKANFPRTRAYVDCLIHLKNMLTEYVRQQLYPNKKTLTIR